MVRCCSTHLGAAFVAFGKGYGRGGGTAGVVQGEEVDAHVVVEIIPTLRA